MAHPLDPLTADEIRVAAAVLRRDRGVTDRWRFATIALNEPPKDALRGAATPAREAEILCWNPDGGDAYKAVVSLTDTVSFWLKPHGFFHRNPARDVAPSDADGDHRVH
jgi:primary-amine oxidase